MTNSAAAIPAIDWPTIQHLMAQSDYSAISQILASATLVAPDHIDTLRLGFSLNNAIRNLPACEDYIGKLRIALGTGDGEYLEYEMTHCTALGDWPRYHTAITSAAARNSDNLRVRFVAYAYQLISQRGLYQGWQQDLLQLLQTPGYDAHSFMLGHQQLALIFYSLGQQRMATELLQDLLNRQPLIGTRAAALLDLGVITGDTKYQQEFLQITQHEPDVLRAFRAWQEYVKPTAAPAPAGAPVSVMVTTHISSKILMHAHIAPPKIDMLAQTLESFYQTIGASRDWPVTICFDQPTAPNLQAAGAQYLTALEAYVAKHPNMRLALYRGNGLRQVFTTEVAKLTTPFLFFLEHDWEFEPTSMPAHDILDHMQRYNFINHTRYNISPVFPDRYDVMLLPEPRIADAKKFTRTNGVSNNPCLIRLAKLRRDWLPVLNNNSFDGFNLGAAGVEENIYSLSAQLTRGVGFIHAHEAIGTYIAAGLGAPRQIIHKGQ